MAKIKIIYIYMYQHSSSISILSISASQLLRCSRACGSYHDFFNRRLLLTRKLLKQRFLVEVITSIVTVVFMTWLTVLEYLCHRWPRMCFVCRSYNLVFLNSFLIYHQRSVVELVIKLIIWLAIITWFILNHIIS